MNTLTEDPRLATAQRALLITGRVLLGLYFIVPGTTKIVGFEQNSQDMAEHGVPLIPVLLVITIVLTLAELSSYFKDSGGPVLFTTTAFGRIAAKASAFISLVVSSVH